MTKLPVFATIRDAFVYTGRNWDLVVVATIIAALYYGALAWFVFAFSGLFGRWMNRDPEVTRQQIDRFGDYVGYLNAATYAAALVFVALVATVWHRRVELGQSQIPTSQFVKIGKRHWRVLWQTIKLLLALIGTFLLCFFAATLMGLLLSSVFDASVETTAWTFKFKSNDPRIVVPALIVFFLILFAIMSRLILVLPAGALDRPLTLRESWRHTRGNAARISVALVVVGLIPTLVVYGILFAIFFSSLYQPGMHISVAFVMVLAAIGLFVSAIIVAVTLGLVLSVLSIAHRHLAPAP